MRGYERASIFTSVQASQSKVSSSARVGNLQRPPSSSLAIAVARSASPNVNRRASPLQVTPFQFCPVVQRSHSIPFVASRTVNCASCRGEGCDAAACAAAAKMAEQHSNAVARDLESWSKGSAAQRSK